MIGVFQWKDIIRATLMSAKYVKEDAQDVHHKITVQLVTLTMCWKGGNVLKTVQVIISF